MRVDEVTPQLLRDCLSDASSIALMQEALDAIATTDLTADAVSDVISAADALRDTTNMSTASGVRAVRLIYNDSGVRVAVPAQPHLYEPPAKSYSDAFDIVEGGRTYAAYVVKAPDGGDFTVVDEDTGRAVEHLRCVHAQSLRCAVATTTLIVVCVAFALQLETEATCAGW